MRNLVFVSFFLLFLAGCTENADLSKEDLVESGATIQKLAGGFKYTEGPAVDAEGNVYFSDIRNNRIHKWSVAEKKMSTFRENSFGISGLYFDKDDNLYACQRAKGRIVSIAPDGKETVLADEYNGKPFNKGNDLWVDPKGGVYFTGRYPDHSPLRQYNGYVFYITPDRKNVIRVVDDYHKPNGIIGSKDGQILYITDRKSKKTYTHKINADGTLSDKKFFASVGSDGMTLDEKGNLYVTTDAVHIFSPDGKEIAVIKVPETPSNLCFGDKDSRTLFITAGKGFYSVQMAVAGMYGPGG
jgi:gluconolactonase